MKIGKKCEQCNKDFQIYPYQFKKGLGRFCSRVCSDLSQVGVNHSPKTQFKKGSKPSRNRRIYKGVEHSNWKGIKVSYEALHIWVRYWKGKAVSCSNCGKTEGRIEWANKDRKYQRNLEDFISLCKSCHTKYDLNLIKQCV